MKKRNYVLIMGLVAMMTFTQYIAAEPIEKTTDFEISQDYDGCAFSVNTEHEGNYIVELSMEGKDEKYTGVIENGNSCVINIENVEKGRWTLKITQNVDQDMEGESIGLSPDEVIGKVKISAKAINNTAFSVGNVQVARDIVGLKEYFKDNSVVVEWTDTGCGDVVISIIDSATQQILDRKTVSGNHYDFELPELTKEISVEVVPATSSNITGAASQTTLKVPRDSDFNADISYSGNRYTNEDIVGIEAVLHDSYSLVIYNNGKETESTDLLDAGTYTFNVPVTEGNNIIQIYIVDTNGNMRSTEYELIRDSVKPSLTLDMEYDGFSTYDETVEITGSVKDYKSFMINETEPTVSGDGTFKSEYILKDGENMIEMKAVDEAGNETIYKATITKLEKKGIDIIGLLPKILFGIVLLIVVIVKTVQKKKNDSNNNSEKNEKIVKEQKKETKKIIHTVNVEKKEKPAWLNDAITLIVTVAVIIVIFTKIISWGYIPSESMEPTLMTGDIAIVNCLAYINSEPERGDIIIFKFNQDGMHNTELIKRVIGLPGDTVEFHDGYVYINGQICYEEYLASDVETNSLDTFTVPEGTYFVMGDNRENSTDSRFWDEPYVRQDDIKGKLLADIPLSKIKMAIKSIFS